tara:strand:+ start:2949 stop:3326 length:378 start_codon:yes stop_codon:yes gene_type:complete
MSMGDGTFMADNAFRESIPMMSYTPEELGINMAAYPSAPKEETAFEIAMRDNSQSGDMPSMTPIEEVTLQQGTSPFLNVVKEDEYDGGVQFNSENLIETHAYTILKVALIFGAGMAFASWRNNRS